MGYDVHITRADNWVESEEHPIELAEWLAYAEEDPDLSRTGPRDGGTSTPGVFNLRVGEFEAWLEWQSGRISTKNPPPTVLAKMHAVADALGARVQGDEGEAYDEHGRQIGNVEGLEPTARGVVGWLLVAVPFFAVLNEPLVGSLCALAIVGGFATFVASWFVFDGMTLLLVLGAAVVAVVTGYAVAVTRVIA